MGATGTIPDAGKLILSLPMAGDVAGATHTLSSATIVGRSSAADLTIDDPTVSRRHAEFYLNPRGVWRVRDLGSHNGVSVNGSKVQDHALQYGDVVHVGNVHMTVCSPDTTNDRSTQNEAALDIRASDNVTIGRLDSPEQPKLEASQLFTIQKLVKRLLQEPDPHKRLTLLCRQMLGPPLGAHHAAVVEFSRSSSGGANLIAGPETVSDRAKDSFYLSRSVVEALRTSNEPVLASNSPVRDESATPLSIISDHNRFAVAACPLRVDDDKADAQQVLYVVLPELLGSMEWLALAALVAEQFVHAEVAWRGRVAAAEQAVIDRDLRQAHRIQLALVPNRVALTGLETTIVFKPCRTVGGDYVDAFELPDGRSLLVVADVAGKGMQAALIASSLHTWLHATLANSCDLGGCITQLNRYLHRTLPDGLFTTLIAAVIDPENGRLEYVNAGHPPILIASDDGQTRQLLTGSNLPLGVMDHEMKTDADSLAGNECMLLYTDGLTESLRSDGAWLGVEGVEQLFKQTLADGCSHGKLDETATNLIERIEQQTTGFDADDRTLLLAKHHS